MLCLARRQYSLLQAANLLTPDMIMEFETLQQLVQEGNAEPEAKASGTPSLAQGLPVEPCSESGEFRSCSVSSRVPGASYAGVALCYTGPAAHLWN